MSKEQMVDSHTRRLVVHLKQLKAPPTTAFWYNLQKSDMERFRRMAYTAAKRGLLGADFPFWTTVANPSDKNQYTLAAVAARYNKLPKGFCGWNVAVSCAARYDPIASYCANKNTLPEDFDRWDLWSHKRREHVAHTMARKHRLPESANTPEIMTLTCGHGTPVAQTAALLKTLPSNYRDWVTAFRVV
ncbi:MAG: hypothetical protein PHN51_10140 [Candidatus Nanopelagicales bacterium]|nr:hypothetical protein [Candidatus Nanopelagicales bacterium]